MAHSQVAYLIPLKADLKEDNSSPRITLSEGPNIIGRGNVSIVDKRLSRKHITIIVSTSGSASLSVVITITTLKIITLASYRIESCQVCVFWVGRNKSGCY
jgi:hypothetical protein